MKRQPKPHFKKSHKAWYVNLNGKQVRLASEEEGHDKAMEVYYGVMAGRLPPQQDQCAATILYRFLQSHGNSPASTRRFYSRPVRSFIDFIGPALRVSDVQPYHVENWMNEYHRVKKMKGGKPTDKPTSSTYRHNLVRAVKSGFQWAEDKGYIAKSPVRKVKVPPQYARGDDAYLEPEQWAQVLATAEADLLDLLVVMYETGCRPQEVRRVESRHFNRHGKCWTFPVDESKGKREQRVVLLSDRALEICQRLALKHPDGTIFGNGDKAWTATALGSRCARVSRKVGFHLTPYMVRHTFATRKILEGVDLVTIATLMGHRDLTMLQKIYQHVKRRSDHLRNALNRSA
ncbi:MAG: tyrosine-type recombinase/integrase [Thermoguttaceae bacterium]|jgi:integrase